MKIKLIANHKNAFGPGKYAIAPLGSNDYKGTDFAVIRNMEVGRADRFENEHGCSVLIAGELVEDATKENFDRSTQTFTGHLCFEAGGFCDWKTGRYVEDAKLVVLDSSQDRKFQMSYVR